MRSSPDRQTVLDALDDPDCRRILRELDAPRTASELSEACDMSLSTTYRKLELLNTATLVEEETRIRQGGHHTREYAIAFEAIEISLDESRHLDLSITHPARTADEQLERIWSEVRSGI